MSKAESGVKGMKVLVIDDEQIVLDSVRRVLEPEGASVDVTLSSRTGLSWALARPYDVVLTDVRMPEIGGMRVLRDIKRATPSVPVLIITGFATVSSAVQAMKLGATDVLEKPFTPESLLAAVRSARTAPAAGPETQELVHREELLRVLERAATDGPFVAELLYTGADALDRYELTGPEKLAILTGDVRWIEAHVGALSALQKRWLEQRLSAEIW